MTTERILLLAGLILAFVSFIALLLIAMYRLEGWHLFKTGRNPYHRICKKCGSHQEQYHEAGRPHCTWWERMYPLGNDENCKCHQYTNYRDDLSDYLDANK